MSDLKDKLNKLKGKKNVEDIPLHKLVPPKKKAGRKSHRKKGVEYVKLSTDIPKTTHRKMKVALVTDAFDLHPTQNEFVDAAILHYIEALRNDKKDN